MKYFYLLFIVSFSPGILFAGNGNQASEENKHVTFSSKISPLQVRAGGNAHLLFTLTAIEGVHINTEPQMDFNFEKSDVVDFIGADSLPTDTTTGYLLGGKPIVYRLKIHPNAVPGKYIIRGVVKYFYCSDKDGWCNRFSQPVIVPVTVVK